MLIALLLAASELAPFIKVDAPAVVLEHVRVIDGTGAPPREDQSLAIVGGKIALDAPPKINDIENVELVFKDGVGFDPQKLVESVRGLVGIR